VQPGGGGGKGDAGGGGGKNGKFQLCKKIHETKSRLQRGSRQDAGEKKKEGKKDGVASRQPRGELQELGSASGRTRGVAPEKAAKSTKFLNVTL